MNIFIMILVALFMAGFYMMGSPSQHVAQHNTEYAVTQSDLRTVAQCATAMHNAQINGTEFVDICVEQNGLVSKFVCLDTRFKITNCNVTNNKKPAFSYIVTATAPMDSANYNAMMEILEKYYSESGTFGLFQDGKIVSGGTSSRRVVPAAIVQDMKITDGQLVYFTQYEIPDTGTQFTVSPVADVVCPVGTAKTYRFGRWQCIPYNVKTDCGGDMIWDSDLYQCVPDESTRPLCADSQTAVMVDNVWECISPFPEKQCPKDMVARLNYNTFEWECVADPTVTKPSKKCSHILSNAIYGGLGTTLRVPQTSCTDCERMVIDSETCTSYCVPDAEKINDPQCYPGNVRECNGPTRAFYFGFPSYGYVSNVTELSGVQVTLDQEHSQNRRFNCMDCGEREIDASKSRSPFVAVCK